MYNLHCHSLLSDGVLLPSEIAVRYQAAGYKVIAITDHVDYSNIEFVVEAMLNFCRFWPKGAKIQVLPGVELTHLPLSHFKPLSKYARKKGAKIIVAHGETLAEPMTKGTNRAALEADIDILAHPGLISDEDILFAKKRGIFLEITARAGHNLTNRHVAERALKLGAKLIINNDSHEPKDIISQNALIKIAAKAGLDNLALARILEQTKKLISSKN